MMLVVHIGIAFSSLLVTGFALAFPSKAKLAASYSLVGLTIASGTILIISSGSPLLKACITGLAYLAFVLAGIFAAQHKLNLQTIKNK